MICTGYIKSAWRTGAVWELLAERKHRTKSQCDWPPPRLYIEVAYIGENRAFFLFVCFFLSVSPSRVDSRNFVRYPSAQTGTRCLIRKTSQFHRGSLFLSASRRLLYRKLYRFKCRTFIPLSATELFFLELLAALLYLKHKIGVNIFPPE